MINIISCTWIFIRIIILCLAFFMCIVSTGTAVSIPAIAIISKRNTNNRESTFSVWLLQFVIQGGMGILAFCIWKSLYYEVWSPIIWGIIFLIPYFMIVSILDECVEKHQMEKK